MIIVSTVVRKVSAWACYFVFISGVLSLFIPHMSGWADIVFPSIAHLTLFLYFMWSLFLVFAFTCLGLSLVIAFVVGWPKRNKIVSLALMVVLLLIYQLVYTPGDIASDGAIPLVAEKTLWGAESDDVVPLAVKKRIGAFPVGGQTRVFWAGGVDKVREDALLLLKTLPDENGFIPPDEWPDTLNRLGAVAIETDEAMQTVIMYIPRADYFDPDVFGYLIRDGEVPDPEILCTSRFVGASGYRMWKIDEGLFFFEAW